MTKEEFLKMVDVAIEQLMNEREKCLSRVEYYKSVNPNGKEIDTANYQYLVVSQKVNAFIELMGLPTYTRIQSMSDAEIEEYKRDKINEIKLDGITIAADIEKLKKEIAALKAQHEELMDHFVELEMTKRNSAINEGKRIQFDIQAKELKLNELELKLLKLKSKQEEILQMSSSEVKEQLTSEIGNRYNLSSIVDKNDTEKSSSALLKEIVGKNPEKAIQMARLLTDLALTEKRQGDIHVYLNVGYGIPSQLKQSIESDYAFNRGDIHSTQRFFDIYESFMEQFNKEVAIFNSQFTIEKLGSLIEKQHDYIRGDVFVMGSVDFEFLKLHSDKLSPGEIEQLQAKVLKRDKLSKKLIKTREVKREIEDLTNDISRTQKAMYRKIAGWYRQYDGQYILGIHTNFILERGMDGLAEQLKSCSSDLDKTTNELKIFKGKLESAKIKLENLLNQHREKVDGIKQQIRSLGGAEFENSEIPWAQERTEDNLSNIAASVAYGERRQFVSQVQEEAQNQANMWQPNSNSLSQENVTEENIGGKTL